MSSEQIYEEGATYTILYRTLAEVNTDPQRRCYNGAHYSSELRPTPWEDLELKIPSSEIKRRLEFWKELNDYAVSQRGKWAKREFKVIKEVQEPISCTGE